MLNSLSIRDFAIISALDLRFSAGLTVVTGETGAGKSIVLDALSLLTGARADSGAVRSGTQRAEVSAEFSITDLPAVQRWLREAELDDAATPELVQLRRIVRAEGSSKAWINGRAVALVQLRELAEQLIEIHGQHESLMLQEPSRQLAVVDQFAGNDALLAQVREQSQQLKALVQEMDQLKALSGSGGELMALLQQQLAELDKLNLAPEHLNELDQKQRKLANAEALIEALDQALQRLDRDTPHSAGRQLAWVQNELNKYAQVDNKLREAAALLESASIEIVEANELVSDVRQELALDPAQLSKVEAELSKLHELARKHRIPVPMLQEKADELRARTAQMQGADLRLSELLQARSDAQQRWQNAASKLSSKRQAAAKKLTRQAEALMQELGMQGGKLGFEFQDRASADFAALGAESGEFVVSTNAGQALRPIRKVASGGELSRLGLALKVSSLAEHLVPVLLFDEVDAGIGGAVADTVGRLLGGLGRKHQVLVVTHLAQVAAHGTSHLRVEKTSDGLQTQSSVQRLDDAARVDELARMLAGHVTSSTQAAATELRERALAAP